jgi:hypothetical protein
MRWCFSGGGGGEVEARVEYSVAVSIMYTKRLDETRPNQTKAAQNSTRHECPPRRGYSTVNLSRPRTPVKKSRTKEKTQSAVHRPEELQ